MGLNLSKGNMYEFITHTWNTIKGKCAHNCSYCYMKRWGNQKPVRFDHKELKTDLGTDNHIFVGSSCDMFADDIPENWIIDTLLVCSHYQHQNEFFFQTKNPERISKFLDLLPMKSSVCTTIETNRWYPEIMMHSPTPSSRAAAMSQLVGFSKYVTIEPIMEFDVLELYRLIFFCKPIQVNIGADSGGNDLPEPSKEKILELIKLLETFTKVHQKKNLKRLLK